MKVVALIVVSDYLVVAAILQFFFDHHILSVATLLCILALIAFIIWGRKKSD